MLENDLSTDYADYTDWKAVGSRQKADGRSQRLESKAEDSVF